MKDNPYSMSKDNIRTFYLFSTKNVRKELSAPSVSKLPLPLMWVMCWLLFQGIK